MLGNLRESAWPYLLEHLRLARLSFAMWGALSPSKGIIFYNGFWFMSCLIKFFIENPPSAFGENENGDGSPSKTAKKSPKSSISDDTAASSSEIKEASEVKQRNISQAELESQLFKVNINVKQIKKLFN